MNIKINATLTGEDILKFFLSELKGKNIEVAWKQGSNPSQTRILVTNKNGEDIEISPDKIKVVYNNS